MKTINSIMALTLGTCAFASSGALAEGALQNAKEAVQEAIYDMTDKDTVTLNFPKGSATITDSARAELKTTLAAVRNDAKLKEVIVVAYADQPYPREQKDNLSKAQRDLAKKRGENVKDALSTLGASSVTVYNMAEKANWFEKTLKLSDAEIKGEAREKVENQSADDAFNQALGKRLRSIGGAGKVVTVMRYDVVYSH